MGQEALQLRSEKWLRTFCEKEADTPGYEATLIAAARSDGDYSVHFGEDASGAIPSEFWYHFEIVTGIKIENPPDAFSCSC